MADASSTRESTARRPLVVRGTIAVVVAVVANVVVVAAADALGLAPSFRPLTLPPVVFLSTLGAVGATVTYWLLDRYVADADRTFVRVAVAVLVLSFVPDAALLAADPAATVAGVFALVLMHVFAAAAAVWALVYWGRPV